MPWNQAAEAPFLHRLPDFLHRFVEPVLVAGADIDPFFLCQRDDFIRIRQRQRDRLFDNQVYPGFDAVQRDSGVFPLSVAIAIRSSFSFFSISR